MAFISDKWRDSSVFTKGATFAMALNTLIVLVLWFVLFAPLLFVGSKAGGDAAGASAFLAIVYFLFFPCLQALFTFGIFKVNRAARVFTILEGLGAVLWVIGLIAAYKAVIGNVPGAAQSAQASGFLAKLILGLLPAKIQAAMGGIIVFLVSPFILQILSMLLLIIGGKDFAKIKKGIDSTSD